MTTTTIFAVSKEHELVTSKLINLKRANQFGALRLNGVVIDEYIIDLKNFVFYSAVAEQTSAFETKKLEAEKDVAGKKLDLKALETDKTANADAIKILSGKIADKEQLIKALTASIAIGKAWLHNNATTGHYDGCVLDIMLPCDALMIELLKAILTGNVSTALINVFRPIRKPALDFHKADLSGSKDFDSLKSEFKKALDTAMEQLERRDKEQPMVVSNRTARFNVEELRLVSEMVCGFQAGVSKDGNMCIQVGREKTAINLLVLLAIGKKQNVKITADNVEISEK